MGPEMPMIFHYIIHQREMCCKVVSLEMEQIGRGHCDLNSELHSTL